MAGERRFDPGEGGQFACFLFQEIQRTASSAAVTCVNTDAETAPVSPAAPAPEASHQ